MHEKLCFVSGGIKKLLLIMNFFHPNRRWIWCVLLMPREMKQKWATYSFGLYKKAEKCFITILRSYRQHWVQVFFFLEGIFASSWERGGGVMESRSEFVILDQARNLQSLGGMNFDAPRKGNSTSRDIPSEFIIIHMFLVTRENYMIYAEML